MTTKSEGTGQAFDASVVVVSNVADIERQRVEQRIESLRGKVERLKGHLAGAEAALAAAEAELAAKED